MPKLPFTDPESHEDHRIYACNRNRAACPACRIELGPGGIEELNLSVRSYNCLRRAGILRISTLACLSDVRLLGLLNFRRKSLIEVRRELAKREEGPSYYYGA